MFKCWWYHPFGPVEPLKLVMLLFFVRGVMDTLNSQNSLIKPCDSLRHVTRVFFFFWTFLTHGYRERYWMFSGETCLTTPAKIKGCYKICSLPHASCCSFVKSLAGFGFVRNCNMTFIPNSPHVQLKTWASFWHSISRGTSPFMTSRAWYPFNWPLSLNIIKTQWWGTVFTI